MDAAPPDAHRARPILPRALATLVAVLFPVLFTAVITALTVLPAAAYDESAAPSLRSDVLSAGHTPDVVRAGEPWSAHLQLAPGSNVTAALFQVCRVGQACFNPPTPAESAGNGTFRFAASDVLAAGEPVRFAAGWRVGVKWHLQAADGSLSVFPPEPECARAAQGAGAMECQEAHYLAFDVAEGPGSAGASGLAAWPLAAGLLALALWRRHA